MNGPILDKAKFSFSETTDFTAYPFSVPLIKNLQEITFHSKVTFFVGENGSGKSTILEAIASKIGFGPEGGSKNINFKTSEERTYKGAENLANCLKLSWRMKPKYGYFFRAESFFNVANYIDSLGGNAYASYGGKSLHEQSHGESFLAFFKSRLNFDGDNFFILDEPEAAFSPQRQLAWLAIIHQLCKRPYTQFIIATHSPVLLAYPGATIYSCDGDSLTTCAYEDTDHYVLTKNFLNNHKNYLRYLLET